MTTGGDGVPPEARGRAGWGGAGDERATRAVSAGSALSRGSAVSADLSGLSVSRVSSVYGETENSDTSSGHFTAKGRGDGAEFVTAG